MQILIEATDGEHESLADWLRDVRGLSVSVRTSPGAPIPGELGSRDVLIVAADSSGAVSMLAKALVAWMQSRRVQRPVSIITDDGRRIEVTSADLDDQATLVSNLLHAPSRTPGIRVGDDLRGTHSTGTSNNVGTVHNVTTGNSVFAVQLGDLHVYVAAQPVPASTSPASAVLPVSIYLADEEIHGSVEAAVEALLALADLRIERRDPPVLGSWFRRMWAAAVAAARSPLVREGALVATHVADTRLVLAQDATVTATLLANLGPVIASLQPTRDAVIRVGALLIVKADWIVSVHQLTAAQQTLLDHRPTLASSPHEIIAALSLKPANEGSGPPTR